MEVSLDFETRSAVDLKRAGVYRYAEHASTDIWCACYAVPGDPEVRVWIPGEPLGELGELAADSGVLFRAWNAQFERIIWREIMVKRYGAPEIALERWRCTAAEAAAMSLPRSLDACAQVLGAAQKKDRVGHHLMLRMSKPRRQISPTEYEWWVSPERVARLIEYCMQDVRTERGIKRRVRDLWPAELEIYQLDQRINDRGILLDRDLAEAVRDLTAEAMMRASTALRDLTKGAVTSVTQRAAMLAFLRSEGLTTEKLDKAIVRNLLDRDDITPEARHALTIRAEAAKSSVAKVDAMLDCVGTDGRMRGLLLYHGASTGRWAGRLIQPQNLPARSRALGSKFKAATWTPVVLDRDYDRIDLAYPPLEVLAMQLRPCLRAAPGHRFIGADYAAVEARIVAWLADERWLLDAFARGDDAYRMMASAIYQRPVEEIGNPSRERDMGKRVVLGCGFGMGAAKLAASCEADGVQLGPADATRIIEVYRKTNSRIAALWYELERTAVTAVGAPGEKVSAAGGKLVFVCRGDYLWVALPCRTRALAYPKPSLVDRMTPWGQERKAVVCWGETGPDRKWRSYDLYGGLLTENIVQATARDLMAAAMLRLEAAGYPIVLTVHDEILTEVPEGFGSVRELETLMAEAPAWAQGCPVKAEGWEGQRYVK